MSYSRYDHQEHMRDHYDDYMERHERYKDDLYYEEQGETHATHTTSGAPLDKLVHVTNIPYYEGRFAAVNWCPLSNEFLICEPGQEDWVIPRTEETLRAFARIIAFNPKEWGCWRCGCSSEVKDRERICWCDVCQKDGCGTPSRLVEHIEIVPRVKSQYFMKRRGSLPPPPPPPVVPLERLTAVGSSDTFFEPTPISPKSPSSHPLSAEDYFLRFKSS
uniref:Uncharacterized protein n=1 Tax=viral metagenome TaxID=1070528 RepID=A0A6C0LQQ9_9ZZZZ